MRLGGAYELFHLAQDTESLRQTVLDILCAHIRRTTGEAVYREKHESKPSEEIQSLLTLLFVQEHEVFKGLNINLQGSWINGSNLLGARLVKAALTGAILRKTILGRAKLQNAILMGAHLQEAILDSAHMQGVVLIGAQMQHSNLTEARMQGSLLGETNLDEAKLENTQLQGIGSISNIGDPRRGISTQFEVMIRESIGKHSDLSGMVFGSGPSQADVNTLVRDGGAITGAYTKEEAEEWIAEYEMATSQAD